MKNRFFITMQTLTETLITLKFLRVADLILPISESRQTVLTGHYSDLKI